jgi:hypothetical protein
LVFGFYFLFKGFRLKKHFPLVISGIFLGLGFYTYISYRFVVFLLAIALIGWWLIYKKEKLKKQFLLSTLYLLLSIFIVALPIGIYFLENPGDFIGRASGVSIFSQENSIYNLGKSLVIHLGMFNFYGDGNWRHNFAGSPELFWPVGLLFLIGFIASIRNLFLAKKEKNSSLLYTLYFIFGWFFIMLLPGVLSFEGIPHSLRVIGVVPIVYIFAGLGGYWIYEKIKVFFETKHQIVAFYVCISIFLLSIVYAQFDKYFFQWALRPETKGAFSEDYVEIGNYLNSLSDNVQKYVIVNQSGTPVPFPNGIPMPAQTPMFVERMKFSRVRSTYLLPKDLNQIKIDKKTVIVPLKYDESLFNEFYQKFPNGKIKQEKGIWIYEIL